MTELFSKVIKEIEVLSEKEQDEFANLFYEELKWSKSFSNSQNLLSDLGKKALAEFRNKTR